MRATSPVVTCEREGKSRSKFDTGTLETKVTDRQVVSAILIFSRFIKKSNVS